MLLREFFNDQINEKQVWARSGKKVVRKYRCSGGKRHGRVVSNIAQCYATPDVKKKNKMKLTRARLGKKMARKSRKTKRVNPASRRVQAMNKSTRKK